MKLGIDFGTCYSLAATVDNLDGSPVVLRHAGVYGVPSVFYYSAQYGTCVGEAAENMDFGSDSALVVREPKLNISQSWKLDGRNFSGPQIVAPILNQVVAIAKQAAESEGISAAHSGNIEGVVLSIPASFSEVEKECLSLAATSKGIGGPELKVLGFIAEPVAAALEHFGDTLYKRERVLVYDLGGGTCDIAVVESDPESATRFRVLSSKTTDKIDPITGKRSYLGGRDWDEKFAKYLIARVENEYGLIITDTVDKQSDLIKVAERIKRQLTDSESILAVIPLSDGTNHRIRVSRTDFENATRELLKKNTYHRR